MDCTNLLNNSMPYRNIHVSIIASYMVKCSCHIAELICSSSNGGKSNNNTGIIV